MGDRSNPTVVRVKRHVQYCALVGLHGLDHETLQIVSQDSDYLRRSPHTYCRILRGVGLAVINETAVDVGDQKVAVFDTDVCGNPADRSDGTVEWRICD